MGLKMNQEKPHVEHQIHPIISSIVVFGVLFLLLNKGVDWYTNYKMIKKADERIEFNVKNNSPLEICSAIKNAIVTANTLTDQKALNRYKEMSKEHYCDSF